MKVNRKQVKQFNEIAYKYNGMQSPKELNAMYDELAVLGISVPMFSENQMHSYKYTLNEEEVENSFFVYMKHEDPSWPGNRSDYVIYFS